jgi:hypothetical protein
MYEKVSLIALVLFVLARSEEISSNVEAKFSDPR